jgi:hypothetical protein
MLVGLSNLTNYNDALKYSLNPSERMLCPFKKHRFSDFRKKYLNENGIIETLEGNVTHHNAISFRYSAYAQN